MIHLDSHYAILPRTAPMPNFTETEIKNEPMLFSADYAFSIISGGPITRAFLQRVPDNIKNDPTFILDTRVHMLMPGWYPCIPGWHLDDIPRTRPDGQPDHQNPAYRAEHLMCLIGDASVTSFLSARIDLEEPGLNEGITYHLWDEEINRRLQNNPEFEVSAPTECLIYFNSEALHRGNPATKNGWRWFARASWSTQRKPYNEIRRQVQVYLPVVNQGW